MKILRRGSLGLAALAAIMPASAYAYGSYTYVECNFGRCAVIQCVEIEDTSPGSTTEGFGGGGDYICSEIGEFQP
jgi:hypothetical protein